MSVKRSPTKKQLEKVPGGPTTPGTRLFVQSESSPDLSTLGQDVNLLSRKRKHGGCDCMDRLEEIRALLSEAAAKSEEKLAGLQASIAEISAQTAGIKKSMEFISKDYDDLKIKLTSLESGRESDRQRILELEEKIDSIDRQLYSTKIEIRNVPEKQKEDKESLLAIVTEAANVVGTPINGNDIRDVFRTKNKNNISTITVDFISAITKDTIIKKARKFNNENKQNKLCTAHLKLDGPSKPIYISEKLTPKAQRIYYLARRFAEDYAYKYCWTSYGKVLLRKVEGERHIVIRNEAELDSLRLKS